MVNAKAYQRNNLGPITSKGSYLDLKLFFVNSTYLVIQAL
jgi:hypothetical protein